MNITVVEIDQKMYEVAVKWFDLEEDNRQRVIIMDGVTFLKNALKEGKPVAIIPSLETVGVEVFLQPLLNLLPECLHLLLMKVAAYLSSILETC